MDLGQTVFSDKVRIYMDRGWVEYRADKGKQFVLIFMGTGEPQKVSGKDLCKTMNQLGWYFKDEVKKKKRVKK